jgi:hypothetical protein
MYHQQAVDARRMSRISRGSLLGFGGFGEVVAIATCRKEPRTAGLRREELAWRRRPATTGRAASRARLAVAGLAATNPRYPPAAAAAGHDTPARCAASIHPQPPPPPPDAQQRRPARSPVDASIASITWLKLVGYSESERGENEMIDVPVCAKLPIPHHPIFQSRAIVRSWDRSREGESSFQHVQLCLCSTRPGSPHPKHTHLAGLLALAWPWLCSSLMLCSGLISPV